MEIEIIEVEPRWFPRTKLAKYLQININTLDKWRRKYDDFPAPRKLGATVIFDREEIDNWIKNKKREPK